VILVLVSINRFETGTDSEPAFSLESSQILLFANHPRCARRPPGLATAFSILVLTESWTLSGLFPQEKATFQDLHMPARESKPL
jgi:hypothetical protein